MCRLKGYRAQALAYSIMRLETCWASTDKALTQEWQSGLKGRRRLVAAVEAILQAPELMDFLEGMDATDEEPETIHSKGFWVTMSRMMLLTLPSCRVRYNPS